MPSRRTKDLIKKTDSTRRVGMFVVVGSASSNMPTRRVKPIGDCDDHRAA
jgi:hypothetical protein